MSDETMSMLDDRIAELEDENAALQRENAALRADKERLDWLEGQAKDIMLMGDESGIAVGAATNFQNYVTNAVTFRAAIDAARKEAQP